MVEHACTRTMLTEVSHTSLNCCSLKRKLRLRYCVINNAGMVITTYSRKQIDLHYVQDAVWLLPVMGTNSLSAKIINCAPRKVKLCMIWVISFLFNVQGFGLGAL